MMFNDFEINELIGSNRFQLYQELKTQIDSLYEMEVIFNQGGKKWRYELKYRRASKTLCGFYFNPQCLGFMIILGKAERALFESQRNLYSAEINQQYDNTTTYHDGKWLMLHLEDNSLFSDIIRLLKIKRKPNKK